MGVLAWREPLATHRREREKETVKNGIWKEVMVGGGVYPVLNLNNEIVARKFTKMLSYSITTKVTDENLAPGEGRKGSLVHGLSFSLIFGSAFLGASI